MPVDWWLMPVWLDLELRRYLAACSTEIATAERTGEEVTMAKDPRTYNEKLADKHGGLRGDNTRDAQKQGGKPGEPKRK